MKATYENCYEIAKNMRKNFSEDALSWVADDAEDLCHMLACEGVFEFADDEAEVDEKALKAIIRKVSDTYRHGVKDTYSVMCDAASKLI